MTRVSCPVVRLPTLRVMTSVTPNVTPTVTSRARRSPLAACIIAGVLLPATGWAQNSAVVATATVVASPLAVASVSRTAVPGELSVAIDGCGSGAVTVDSRGDTGTARSARIPVPRSPGCARRNVSVQLPLGDTGVREFLVSLEQGDSLLSPSFAQFVVPASTAIAPPRGSLVY